MPVTARQIKLVADDLRESYPDYNDDDAIVYAFDTIEPGQLDDSNPEQADAFRAVLAEMDSRTSFAAGDTEVYAAARAIIEQAQA